MTRSNKRIFPTVSQLQELPVQLTMIVPPEWEDRNGHVNVQHYLTLYELGGWVILEQAGFDEDWFSRNGVSVFDLEHHINYLAEIRIGDRVSTYHRVLDFSEKRFHGQYYIVNESTGLLAAMLEYVASCVDMQTRRTAAFPPALATGMATLLGEHRKFGWTAPVCGVMKA